MYDTLALNVFTKHWRKRHGLVRVCRVGIARPVADNGVGHQRIAGDIIMSRKLRDDDRRAMDLLMDRDLIAAAKSGDVSVFAGTDGRLREHVVHVDKVLSLLDHLDVSDPPGTLVGKHASLC